MTSTSRKPGEMVLYDKFGAAWPDLSPSIIPDDFGVGIIISLASETFDGDEDNIYAVIMKDDGTLGTFSLSYLVSLDYFGG